MALHCIVHGPPVGGRPEFQRNVEGIDTEVVPVRSPRRGAWAGIFQFAVTVRTMNAAVIQDRSFLHSSGETPAVGGDIHEHPVGEEPARGIGIIADHGEALCSCRRIAPREGGRDILPVAAELYRYSLSLCKCIRRYRNFCHTYHVPAIPVPTHRTALQVWEYEQVVYRPFRGSPKAPH